MPADEADHAGDHLAGHGHGAVARTAGPTGRYIGSATLVSSLSDAAYRQVSAREFDMLTPANAMKWDATEPARGQFRFGEGDQVVAAARAANQRVRGHTLVWHSQLPAWVRDGSFSQADLQAALDAHIDAVAGHYRGQVYAWDVVNEPFEENGTMRNSAFQRVLGSGYIASAFHRARAADPGAKLYINDYNIEGTGPKSDAMYNLVRSLRSQGVPIDGVGFQGHFVAGQVPSTLRANLQRFADLGVDVALTEVDVRMAMPTTAAKLTAQAADYRRVADACLAVARCVGLSVWDFTDKLSWVPSTFEGYGAALPFDQYLRPKPAYTALAEAFGRPTR